MIADTPPPFACKVQSIADGDTFRCRGIPQRIRIAGIDAPELNEKNCIKSGTVPSPLGRVVARPKRLKVIQVPTLKQLPLFGRVEHDLGLDVIYMPLPIVRPRHSRHESSLQMDHKFSDGVGETTKSCALRLSSECAPNRASDGFVQSSTGVFAKSGIPPVAAALPTGTKYMSPLFCIKCILFGEEMATVAMRTRSRPPLNASNLPGHHTTLHLNSAVSAHFHRAAEVAPKLASLYSFNLRGAYPISVCQIRGDGSVRKLRTDSHDLSIAELCFGIARPDSPFSLAHVVDPILQRPSAQRASPARRCAPGDPVASTIALRGKLKGRIMVYPQGWDRYGRIIARVIADGRDVGSEMVSEGFAVRWPR